MLKHYVKEQKLTFDTQITERESLID